jgi:hypothetical protein
LFKGIYDTEMKVIEFLKNVLFYRECLPPLKNDSLINFACVSVQLILHASVCMVISMVTPSEPNNVVKIYNARIQ